MLFHNTSISWISSPSTQSLMYNDLIYVYDTCFNLINLLLLDFQFFSVFSFISNTMVIN